MPMLPTVPGLLSWASNPDPREVRGLLSRDCTTAGAACSITGDTVIRLRLATEAGFQEITPHSLTHCAGCPQEYYLDGPADPDPHFCCDVYDKRTDRKRLPECVQATNPVIVEQMRLAARRPAYGSGDVVVVAAWRPLAEIDVSTPIVHRTLRFRWTVCECDYHGEFWATLLPGEEPHCPLCVASWTEAMRRALYSICCYATAHLHQQRMDAVAKTSAWQLLTQECWYLLGPNPSWNPPPNP